MKLRTLGGIFALIISFYSFTGGVDNLQHVVSEFNHGAMSNPSNNINKAQSVYKAINSGDLSKLPSK